MILPPSIAGHLHINVLEFIAAAVGVWIELQMDDSPFPRFLAITDSTSVLGWLFKSNFNPNTRPHHDLVARHLAQLLLHNEASLFSQHIAGKSNVVADSLSRDTHITDTDLSHLLSLTYPSQVPQNFHIIPALPDEIISWIVSLVPDGTKHKVLQNQPTRSSLGAFIDGSPSLNDAISTILSWTTSPPNNESNSSRLSRELFDGMNWVAKQENDSKHLPSKPLFQTFVRPSGRTYGLTPSWNCPENAQSS